VRGNEEQERGSRGKGGEMNKTLYVHMNKIKKYIFVSGKLKLEDHEFKASLSYIFFETLSQKKLNLSKKEKQILCYWRS
jgi:hypothetical protein